MVKVMKSLGAAAAGALGPAAKTSAIIREARPFHAMVMDDDADEDEEENQPIEREADQGKRPEPAEPRILDSDGTFGMGGDRCFVHEGRRRSEESDGGESAVTINDTAERERLQMLLARTRKIPLRRDSTGRKLSRCPSSMS
jgi:hypothetical protein